MFYKTPYQKAKEEFEKKYKTNDNTERKNTTTLPNIAYDGSFHSDLTYYRETRKLAALMFEENNLYSYWLPYEETKKEPTEQEINAQLWVKPCEKDGVFIGSDGKPSNIGERWRYLAKYLPDSKAKRNAIEFFVMILGFYDKAIETGADPILCLKEKQEYFDKTISKMTSYIAIKSLRMEVPDRRSADCRVMELLLDEKKQWLSSTHKEIQNEYKKAELLTEDNKRVHKNRAEWMQRMINSRIRELKNKKEDLRSTSSKNKKEIDDCLMALAETITTDDKEYKKMSEEVTNHYMMVLNELLECDQMIAQLRKYCTILSEQRRKPFVRYIDLK